MDFSTPWGRLALTLLGGLAQFYSDNLSQATKEAGRREAQGLYCGALSFGAMKGEDGYRSLIHKRGESAQMAMNAWLSTVKA